MGERFGRGAAWIVGSLVALWVGVGCGGDTPSPTEPPAATETETAAVGDEAAVPRAIPEDLPRYPGAELVSFDNESYAEGLTATFETSASAEEVGRYFDRALVKAGWEIEVARKLKATKPSEGMPPPEDIYVLFVNKDGVEVNIDVSPEPDATRIDLNIYVHEAGE